MVLEICREENVLTIQTFHVGPIRILFAALKEMLVQTNIKFDQNGIQIVDMDDSQMMLINLNLIAEKFQIYECKKEKIVIGVNLPNLFKLISQIEPNDVFTMYIDKCDYEDGVVKYLCLRFDNGSIKQVRTYKLRLVEPDNTGVIFPTIKYKSVINLPSADFQKIIRDMSALSKQIEIRSASLDLFFKCTTNTGECETIRSESNENMSFVQHDPNSITQGRFSLTNLNYFIKCTALCTQIELHLQNKLPLVVKYAVAILGELYLCLIQVPPDKVIA